MISPRTSLVFFAAVVFLPAVTILFAVPTLAGVCALVLVAFVLVVAIDGALFQPDFSQFRLVIPEVVRLSEGPRRDY
jgi:hypothetical protein